MSGLENGPCLMVQVAYVDQITRIYVC